MEEDRPDRSAVFVRINNGLATAMARAGRFHSTPAVWLSPKRKEWFSIAEYVINGLICVLIICFSCSSFINRTNILLITQVMLLVLVSGVMFSLKCHFLRKDLHHTLI